MAANGVRRTLQFFAKTLLNPVSTEAMAKISPFASKPRGLSTKCAFAYRFSISRICHTSIARHVSSSYGRY